MSRLKMFSRRDKAAMKKLREETTPTVLSTDKKSCPNCNAGWFNGKYCADCGTKLSPVHLPR